MSARAARAALVVFATTVAACTSGTSVDRGIVVFGPYTGRDADLFAESVDAFEQASGVDVVYTGSADFVEDLRQRSGGNRRPDVAIVPQPGLVNDLIERDAVLPLSDTVRSVVDEHHEPSVFEDAAWDADYVVPFRRTIKSLVWYRPDVFEANGWAVPETLDELWDLVETIDEDEVMSPWCFSIFSGRATGWPATDWVEDLVLRELGPEAYDEWVTGIRDFDDDEIRAAFERFDEMVVAGERSFGGVRQILQTEVAATSSPLFGDPPGCAMFKQASFADNWFPDGVEIGPDDDVDLFVLPGTSAEPPPLVVGGDAVVQFDDRSDIEAFMAFLGSPEGGRAWAREGGYLGDLRTVDTDSYYPPTEERLAELLLDDDRVRRFDASDVLPVNVGSELLWQRITSWVGGTITLDELLTSVDTALENERSSG